MFEVEEEALFVVSRMDSKGAKESSCGRSRQELSNEYSIHPSENESSKVCQTIVRQLDSLS